MLIFNGIKGAHPVSKIITKWCQTHKVIKEEWKRNQRMLYLVRRLKTNIVDPVKISKTPNPNAETRKKISAGIREVFLKRKKFVAWLDE